MTVETLQERRTILSDFGVDVNLGTKTITGIFDSPHTSLSVGGEVPFSIQESYVVVQTVDVTGVGQGSTLSISGANYVVTDVQPDGTGMTQLILEAQ
tara:strand:+ start:5707 stop:5997 length:291 start_codon:yes stop_codon:yes gene_type:complete